jgi:DNA-binding transcriptional LysR family regulator
VERKDGDMTDEISDLRLFVRMAAAGSLSETARRLNSSLPAMSRRLAAMESRLGARLIDRSTRRFALTEEGVLLYERSLGILGEIDQVEADVGARTRSPRGHLRVGAPLEIGRRRIAPLIGPFCRRFPDVTVELVLDDAPVDVVASDLDVALHDQPTDGEAITRLVLASRRIVCASPAYLERHPTPMRPTDLAEHDCIRLVRRHRVYDRWPFVVNGAAVEVLVGGSLSSNSAEVVHDWTLAGLGIGLKALWDIEDDLAEGRLIEVLALFAGNPINLYVIYPTRSHMPQRVRVFIDFVVDALSVRPEPRERGA